MPKLKQDYKWKFSFDHSLFRVYSRVEVVAVWPIVGVVLMYHPVIQDMMHQNRGHNILLPFIRQCIYNA